MKKRNNVVELSTLKNTFGGEPPMSDLETRVARLENDIGEIKRHYATREDLLKLELKIQEGFTGNQKQIADQTKWIAGIIIGGVGCALAIAKWLF